MDGIAKMEMEGSICGVGEGSKTTYEQSAREAEAKPLHSNVGALGNTTKDRKVRGPTRTQT